MSADEGGKLIAYFKILKFFEFLKLFFTYVQVFFKIVLW